MSGYIILGDGSAMADQRLDHVRIESPNGRSRIMGCILSDCVLTGTINVDITVFERCDLSGLVDSAVLDSRFVDCHWPDGGLYRRHNTEMERHP